MSVRTNSPSVIKIGPLNPCANTMVSAPGLLLAVARASRRLVSPSAAFTTSEVVVTVMVSDWTSWDSNAPMSTERPKIRGNDAPR